MKGLKSEIHIAIAKTINFGGLEDKPCIASYSTSPYFSEIGGVIYLLSM